MTNEETIHWLEIELKQWEDECKSKHPIKEALDMAIKALEQESRLVAHWIDNSDGGRIWNPFQDRYICSNCGRHSSLENYCCNCGAEMEDE